MGGIARSVKKTVKKVVKATGVSKLADKTGVSQLLGMGGPDASLIAAQNAARQQQAMFEAQMRQQNEAAKLSGANMLDNIANVQTGDALAAIDGLTTSKRKRTEGMGISSALGIS